MLLLVLGGIDRIGIAYIFFIELRQHNTSKKNQKASKEILESSQMCELGLVLYIFYWLKFKHETVIFFLVEK